MKKTISLMLALLMIVAVFSACSTEEIKSDDKNLTASVTSQDTETSSDNETDITSSENNKNESNSKNSNTDTKSDKKGDTKSDKKGDTGSSKISSTTSTTSTTTTVPEEPIINELPGVKLTSKVGFNKISYSLEFDSNRNILIAKTYEEFKEIYDNDIGKIPDKYKDYDSFNEEDNYILKYDEKFFQENALVVVFTFGPVGPNAVKIDGVSKKDGELFVGVICDVPGPGEMGIDVNTYWRTLIEVKKSDITDITKITRVKSEI